MSVGLARFPFVRDFNGFDFAAKPLIDKNQIRGPDRRALHRPMPRRCRCWAARRRQDASCGSDRAPRNRVLDVTGNHAPMGGVVQFSRTPMNDPG